jgi:hypothetical protein
MLRKVSMTNRALRLSSCAGFAARNSEGLRPMTYVLPETAAWTPPDVAHPGRAAHRIKGLNRSHPQMIESAQRFWCLQSVPKDVVWYNRSTAKGRGRVPLLRNAR